MKIGDYTIHSIVTSQFKLDGGAMFGIIPKPLWNRKMPADDKNRIQMVTRSLLLVSDDKRILIDTGNGDKWQEKFKKIYEIDTDPVNVESSLATIDFTANDITDVICSHLHFDHIGGNTKYENDKLVPVFQKAIHWMNKENWRVANSPSEKDQGSFMEADWSVLAENNMIKLVDGNEQFLPDINLKISHGHTPGQMLPMISDDRNTLIYCADLIPTTAHIPLAWVMAYDVEPMVTIEEKKVLLSDAKKQGWIMFFEHDPVTEACTIGFDGKNYRKDKIVKIG